ncbi:unnamed protein product [Phytomonas sp. EM1]|nr:unnamed protein product [Phytomonas sp. EM1]|eukprot:CCW60569.1 unnamed protein product [Phytomonas sp. isolate EM1]
MTGFASVANSSDEELEVRLAAPPVEGQANKELVDFMQTTLEMGVRELRNSALPPEEFFAGISHIMSRPTLFDVPKVGNDAVEGGTSNLRRKVKGKGMDKPNGRSKMGDSKDKSRVIHVSENAPLLPTRVEVRVARGTTSRSKLLEVEFPGSEWELACLLEKASL